MIEYGVALDKVTIINLPLLLESQLDSFPFLSHPILHCSIPLLFYYSSMVFPPLFLRFLPSSSSLPFAFRVSWSNAFPANSCRAARFIDLLLLDNGDSCRYLLEMKLSFLSIRRICVEHLGIFTETGRGTAGGGVVFTIGLKPALRKIVSRLFLIYSFPIIITHSSATELFNNSCNSYKWFVQFFHLSRFENVFFLVRFALQRNTLRFERNGNYNSYDEYDYSIQCYREINQSFVVLIIMDISSVIWTWNFVLDGDRVARIRDFEVRGELRNMEKGVSSEETLPTVYGIMIAFLTCVVGYILWVSITTVADIILKKRYTVLFFFSWYIYK